jgi:hypothetical protein
MKKVLISIVGAFSFFAFAGNAGAHPQSDEVSQEKIKELISKTFDQPKSPVKTNPIVIEGKVAIADWAQGQKGGGALLRRRHHDWEIIACGGSSFKDPESITAIGISKVIAANITAKLKEAEAKLSPQQVKQFDSFDGVVNMIHGDQQKMNIKNK